MEATIAAADLYNGPALKPGEFAQIRRLAYEQFGLDIKDGKESLIVTRLSKELRRLGMRSYDEYLSHVASDRTGDALVTLANALTTNFTSFLREEAHFRFLREEVAPRIGSDRAVDVWSAASSTGEEVYSILFTMLDALGPSGRVRILGTDISTKALRAASDAVYHGSKLQSLPPSWLQRFFLKGNNRWAGSYRVRPEYRAMVSFERFNLVTDLPGKTHFPAIFCRNVAIYFDKTTQAAVARKLSSALTPGGYLFIGHSESLSGMDHGLRYVQPALYQRPGGNK